MKLNIKKNIKYLTKRLFLSNKNNIGSMEVEYNDKPNQLNRLCRKYGCDKGYFEGFHDFITWKPHNYTDLYHFLFSSHKMKVKNVFELGIGTNKVFKDGLKRVSRPGASLRVWRDYFPNASIYGGDIDPKTMFIEKRIRTFKVDQFSASSIKRMWNQIKKKNFDLIIDDGCHQFEGTVKFFLNSINLLSNDGFYIIEDVYNKDKIRFLEYFAQLDYKYYYFDLSSKFNQKDNNLFIIKKL